MSETHSVPSAHNFKREDAARDDPNVVAKLQQAANLANENCDRATVLAQKLSAQLREAQSRINELELEADGLANRILDKADAAVARLQSDASASVEQAKHEAAARIARAEQRLAKYDESEDKAILEKIRGILNRRKYIRNLLTQVDKAFTESHS